MSESSRTPSSSGEFATPDGLLVPEGRDWGRDLEAAIYHATVQKRARELSRPATSTELPPWEVNGAVERAKLKDQAIEYYIEGLLPKRSRVLVIAQYKVGKTSLMTDMSACLLRNMPFLGRFDVVDQSEAHIGYSNFEVDQITFWQQYMWPELTDADLARFHPIHTRGYRIDLMEPVVQEFVVHWLVANAVSIWVIDTFSRAIRGNQDTAEVAGEWCDTVDEIARRAGVDVVIVVAHAGYNNTEHVRGSSALMDWPDFYWLYERKNGDRVLQAEGRFPAVLPMRVAFSESGLLVAGSGPAPSDLNDTVVAFVRVNHGVQKSEVKNKLGMKHGASVAAIDALLTNDRLHFHKPRGRGEGNTQLLFVGPRRGCPVEDGKHERQELLAIHPPPPPEGSDGADDLIRLHP